MRNADDNLNPGQEAGERKSGGGIGLNLDGRPFPPEEAADRLDRIKAGGVDFIRYRLPVTALETTAPDVYNEEYLAYLRKIFLAADAAELSITVDSRGEGPGDIPQTPDEEERFLDTLRHAYRRLKNCKAVTGWTIPAGPGPCFSRRFTERMREVNLALKVYTE
jgi:hypothetical protein